MPVIAAITGGFCGWVTTYFTSGRTERFARRRVAEQLRHERVVAASKVSVYVDMAAGPWLYVLNKSDAPIHSVSVSLTLMEGFTVLAHHEERLRTVPPRTEPEVRTLPERFLLPDSLKDWDSRHCLLSVTFADPLGWEWKIAETGEVSCTATPAQAREALNRMALEAVGAANAKRRLSFPAWRPRRS